MILFFGNPKLKIFAVKISEILSTEDLKKLSWVLDSSIIDSKQITEKFIGPKSSMITPWSTNAVEITRNMGVKNIDRIEVFICHEISENFDKDNKVAAEYCEEFLNRHQSMPDLEKL